MKLRYLLALTIFLAAGLGLSGIPASGPASGESPAPSAAGAMPAVEELVAEGLRRAPSVEALRRRLAGAREMIVAAGALPNPMLEFMVSDVGFAGVTPMSMATVAVEQELPSRAKRNTRQDAARAEAEVKAAQLGELRVRLATSIRALYARIYAVEVAERTLASGEELLRLLSASTIARYRVGQAEMEEAARAELKLAQIRDRRRGLAAERETLRAALLRLLDRPADSPLGNVAALPDPPELPADLQAAALRNASMLAVARAEVAAAEQRLELTRLEARPDFRVGAGGGFTFMGMPVAILKLGRPLAIWKNNREPPIRAAEDELEAARADLRDAEAEVRSEVLRLAEELTQGRERVRIYRDSIVPRAKLSLDAARASYLAGRGGLAMALDDFGMWLEAKAELAAREAEVYIAWAELEALYSGAPGLEPEGRTP
jgi:outer membrane protein TolC